jgi:hypothetical protein
LQRIAATAQSGEDGRVGDPDFRTALTPEARQVFDAWRALKADDRAPRLLALAPHRLPASVLSRLMVFHAEPDGNWLCTVVGEEMRGILATSAKGHRLAELLSDAERTLRHQQFEQIVRTGLPLWYSGPLQLDEREHVVIGRLAVPLVAEAGEAVILVAYSYLGDPELVRLRRTPQSALGPTRAIFCTEADLGV